jgi:hypothetical protein
MDRNMKLLFYAFSTTVFFFKEVVKILQEKDKDIECKFILPRGHFFNFVKDSAFYLYENFNEIYNKMPCYNITTLPKDNIFKILEIDKNEDYNYGYKSIDKNEQIKRINTIYSIYKEFLKKFEPDYVVFPDVETVDGNILINLCYELNIEVIYTVHLRQLGTSFFSSTIYETLPVYFGKYSERDLKRANYLLENFFSISSRNLLKTWEGTDKINLEMDNLIKRSIRSLKLSFTTEKLFKGEGHYLFHKIKMNLISFVEYFRKIKFDYFQHKYFDIKDDSKINNLPNKFILFALQVTPESSINSLEPYFIDQLRAIDLIRLNMPNDFYLVVKEHPSMIGLRENSYYETLRKKAGIILVSPYVNTKEIMKKAKLISTITGTIGLESIMNDKPILMFGPTFFSHLVKRYDSYLNLKNDIYDLIYNFKPLSKDQKIIEIAKLYNISYNFMLFDPIANPEVMEKGNIKNFAFAIKDHIKKLEVYKKKTKCAE